MSCTHREVTSADLGERGLGERGLGGWRMDCGGSAVVDALESFTPLLLLFVFVTSDRSCGDASVIVSLKCSDESIMTSPCECA